MENEQFQRSNLQVHLKKNVVRKTTKNNMSSHFMLALRDFWPPYSIHLFKGHIEIGKAIFVCTSLKTSSSLRQLVLMQNFILI